MLKGIPSVTVVVGETLAMVIVIMMVMMMIPHRRMNSLLHLYL